MITGRIDPRYGDASATAPPWEEIESLLEKAPLYWIVTVRPDGRPHAVPLVGVWRKGKFAFCTGEPEQKHRNFDSNAQVAVATGGLGAQGWNVGLDVVVEGRVTQVTDADELQILADAWFAKYGDDWKWTVRGDEFVDAGRSADSDAGGAQVFVVTPAKVIVFGNAHGQTTYKF